jgi:hypothetical protein
MQRGGMVLGLLLWGWLRERESEWTTWVYLGPLVLCGICYLDQKVTGKVTDCESRSVPGQDMGLLAVLS